jgi:hypothetical protein
MNYKSLESFIVEIEKNSFLYQFLDFEYQNCRWQVYPIKIVFLEGHLGLIARSLNDGCLVKFPLGEIYQLPMSWHKGDLSKISETPNYDIENFITGIRLILEVEVRLILKIYNLSEFHLDVPYHFFRSATMVTNSLGESIWAAHIEPSYDICQWIYKMGSNVEILDPVKFKKYYLNYLENLLPSKVA